MPHLKLRDGAELFYKDWGNPQGPIVTFSHGWPLSSDNWENQMFYLAEHGTVSSDTIGGAMGDLLRPGTETIWIPSSTILKSFLRTSK